MTADAVAPDNIVRALTIKGSAPIDGLASAVLSNRDRAQPVIDRLIEERLIEKAGTMFRLTRDGKVRGRQLRAADAKQWGSENATAALDGFHSLDTRMKETITAWQLRDVGGTQVLNDHTDSRYDAMVLGRLAALHQDMSTWVSSLSAAPESIGLYLARLQRALQSARLDPRYLASPAVDSYHGVWFELHETLILLAGRNRGDEAAAGRA